ncbi:MAG: hypothetical protein ACLFQK_06835 [Fibrobacterota bacterium]
MKKVLMLGLFLVILMPFAASAKGGLAPCLATCVFGDTRLGLEMNEGKEIQTYDWLNLAGNVLSSFGGGILNLYVAYDVGYKAAGTKGCLSACLWGPRAGRDFNEVKIRKKEVMLCIPIVNIVPAVLIPLEAYSGKTYQQIIEEENLKRN